MIAIDGPGGSGKTTLAKLLAAKLGVQYVDTGAMYRAVAVVALREGISLTDGAKLGSIAAELELAYDDETQVQRVFFRGEDLTESLRSPDVTRNAALVAQDPVLRDAMRLRQRQIADVAAGIVMEGRDIQTAVLPDADLKIFLVANEGVRASRRAADYQEAGIPASAAAVEEALKERDLNDSRRECNPLQKAPDALELCSDEMDPEELAARALQKLKEKVRGGDI